MDIKRVPYLYEVSPIFMNSVTVSEILIKFVPVSNCKNG